jgi:hypothetical protein
LSFFIAHRRLKKNSPRNTNNINGVQLFVKLLFSYLDHLDSLGVRHATD